MWHDLDRLIDIYEQADLINVKRYLKQILPVESF